MVKFGGIRAHILSSDGGSIYARVPKTAHTGKISVHTSGGTALSATRFKVVASAQ